MKRIETLVALLRLPDGIWVVDRRKLCGMLVFDRFVQICFVPLVPDRLGRAFVGEQTAQRLENLLAGAAFFRARVFFFFKREKMVDELVDCLIAAAAVHFALMHVDQIVEEAALVLDDVVSHVRTVLQDLDVVAGDVLVRWHVLEAYRKIRNHRELMRQNFVLFGRKSFPEARYFRV